MERLADLPPPVAAAARVMSGFPAPWGFAGGWALDLFLGRLTRPHADVDLALFRADQELVRGHLAGWRFQKVARAEFANWRAGEWLSPPVHEIHARSPDGFAVELLLNEREGGEWVFRRDPRVRCPAAGWIVRSPSGLPVLSPAVVLLYKAKQPRETDLLDFRSVRENLGAQWRTWLRAALSAVHPGHPWITEL